MQHKAKKSLGQNFLQDKNIQLKIVNLLDKFDSDQIVEIGPGLGALTLHLLKRNEDLTLIEFDEDIIKHWQNEGHGEAKLLHSDILKVDLSKLGSNISVIGNIPYNITSPILFHLFDYRDAINASVLMMQKEVAERLSAKVGTKAYGILTVFTEFYAKVKYEFTIPAGVFHPKPKVESAVISLQFQSERYKSCTNILLFKRIVRESFNKRRKMLRASIKHLLPENIDSLSIDLTRRPESLSVDEFIIFANELDKLKA